MGKTRSPTLLITRPKASAERFAASLEKALPSANIVISPVLEINYLAPKSLPASDALVFTSAHGVEGFLRAKGPTCGNVFCVGSQTALAAQQAGFHVMHTAQTIDALLPSLKAFQGTLLHPRGVHVTKDIGAVLPHADGVIVYDQAVCALSGNANAALKGENAIILPLFSPRSARELAKQIGTHPNLFAVFLSAAVKQAFQNVELREERLAKRPDADSMIEACVGLHAAASELEDR